MERAFRRPGGPLRGQIVGWPLLSQVAGTPADSVRPAAPLRNLAGDAPREALMNSYRPAAAPRGAPRRHGQVAAE